MTQDEEKVLNELSQMDQMGQFVQTVTPGYGLFPAAVEVMPAADTIPAIAAPTVTP